MYSARRNKYDAFEYIIEELTTLAVFVRGGEDIMFGSIACIKRDIFNEYIPLYCYYDLLPFLQRYQQHNVCYSPKLYLLVELLSFHGASSNTRFFSSKKRFLLWNLLSFHGASFTTNLFVE